MYNWVPRSGSGCERLLEKTVLGKHLFLVEMPGQENGARGFFFFFYKLLLDCLVVDVGRPGYSSD